MATTTRPHEAFVEFMVDYTAFLARMRADEKEKMSALASRNLAKIEHSITVSQANAKQLANYEEKRLRLQAEAGYEGMSFRQLIAETPEEGQDALWQLLTRFEGNVAEIRFFNDKSMAVARDSMIEIDPSSVLAAKPGERPSNPYEKIREEQHNQGTILETKV